MFFKLKYHHWREKNSLKIVNVKKHNIKEITLHFFIKDF